MRRTLLAILPALLPLLVLAADAPSGAENLKHFFQKVQSFTARFDQVVQDDRDTSIQEASGRLWLERPGKFRWDYDKPFKQQIVGDGKNVWIYDEELQQITVRELSGALAEGPAMLLAGRGKIEDQFTIKDIKDTEIGERMTWVELSPKRQDTGFEHIRIGFNKGKISAIETIDGFGQKTRYALTGGMENIKIKSDRFTFIPPEGVDVIGEP